jgi:PAS domain S-box-containing protein
MSAADLWERIRSSHYHPWLRAWPRRYAFAVLAVAVVTALQLGLRQLGLLHLTFTLFYPTVVLVAMQAGFGPGILATALAATSGGYFFLEPQNSFVVRTPEDLVAPTLFAFIGVSLTLLTYSRNRAKEALRVTESDLNRAQAVAHVGSWHYDIPGNALALSEETYRIMGLPPGSLVTPEQTIEIFHPDDKERIRRACNVALESGTYEGEGRVLVGGRTRRVRIQANIERDVEGRPLAAVGTVQDITEHKLAQERLREFERVVEGLDDMILVVDRDYRYVLANRAFLGARGVEPKQLVGRRLAEIMGDEVFETTIKPKLEECFQGKVVNYEKRYNYPSLGERDFCVSYFPLTGPTGVERVAVLMQDVTEKKRAAEALRESEDRCRDLIENSEDLVCTHDLEGRLLSMNPAPARFLGYEVGELLKIPMRELIAPEFREQFDAYLERIRTTGADKGLLCVLTRTGERRIWEYNNTLRTEGVPSPLVRGMARDITERKQVETELRRREHDYRQFVAQSSEGILREDLATAVSVDLPEDELISRIRRDSYVAECNDALAKMYGFQSAQDLIGKRLAEMLIPGDPGNLELMRDYVRGGFRLLERESHEVDIHGNPKIFRNSMFGIVESGRLLRTWGIQRDVTERVRLEEEHARAQALVSLQKEILEMIAKGRPLEESLTTLVRLIESQITGLFASVVLLDEDGVHVRHGAAPSLPEGFAKAIDGAAIGPSAGSCGTAMYRKETVIVTDVVEDPLWKDYRDLALANGLRACWSAPVFSAEGKVLGSFAMYYREPRGPSAAEMRLVEVATHLASIAIERRRGEDSLRKSEERFRVALKDSPITVFNQDRDLHYT